MTALKSFELAPLLDSALCLAVAFVLGTLIGAERQYRQRTAGLRTNVLVAVGAAAFVDLGMRLNGSAGAVQMASYVVSGIGFLGAGVIMKEGMNIRGLNTAATLWGSAALGAASGAKQIGEAVLVAIAVLAGNTLLRPLVNAINRAPLDEQSSEATYELRASVSVDRIEPLRDRLVEVLEAADYPVRTIEIERETDEDAEIVATLVSTAIVPHELDGVVRVMTHEPGVTHATWTARASG